MIAYLMVTQMGFSDALGRVDLYSTYQNLSSETKERAEAEVRRLVEEGHRRATKTLTERRKDLDLIANALVEYEVLSGDEIRRILKGEKLDKLTADPERPIKVPEISLPPRISGGPSATGSPPPPPPGFGEGIPGFGGSHSAEAGKGTSGLSRSDGVRL